jgi:hypothetical protein
MTEMINEMFDLKTAKGYEFTLASDEEYSAMPTVKFQAAFTADNGVEYAFRAYTAKKYGKHTRILAFMRKKSKNFSQNITVDKGTFKKVLVTFMRCYEAYKSTKDGQKNTSFAIILQNSLKDYASLFVRATSRIFRTQKKIKLELHGVNENGKSGSIELMYVNPTSIYPYFGGKEYDHFEFTGNETHVKLADIEGKNVEPKEVSTPTQVQIEPQAKKTIFEDGDHVLVYKDHGLLLEGSVGKIKYIDVKPNGDMEFTLTGYVSSNAIVHPKPRQVSTKFAADEHVDNYLTKLTTNEYYDVLDKDIMPDGLWKQLGIKTGKHAKLNSNITKFEDDVDADIIVNFYWMKNFPDFKKAWNEGFSENSEIKSMVGKFYRVVKSGLPILTIGSIGFVEDVVGNDLILNISYSGEDGSTLNAKFDIDIKYFNTYCELVDDILYKEQMNFLNGEIQGIFFKYVDGHNMFIKNVKSASTPLQFTAIDEHGNESHEYYNTYKDFWLTCDIILPSEYVNKAHTVKVDEPEVSKNEIPEVQYVKMINGSGSSKLKAGAIATVVSTFANADEQLLDDFDIKSKNLLGQPVMIVVTDSGYHVALPWEDGKTETYMYTIISADEYAASKGVMTQSSYNKGNPPVKRPDAPIAAIPSYSELLKNLKPVEVGPISLEFKGVSVIDISEKLNEVSNFFGSIDKGTALNIARTAMEKLDSFQRSLASKIDRDLKKMEMHFNDKTAPYEQYNSLRHYTGSGYDSINKRLRGSSDITNKDQDIKNIDNAFAQNGVRLPSDFRVYRGASITTAEIEELNKGNAYEMTGYTSTSLGTTTAYTFTKMGEAKNPDYAVAGVNGEPVSSYVPSTQGNKILFDINRLDRCLGLYVAGISNYSTEYEYILNRGTFVKNRGNHKVIQVAKDPSEPEKGYWFAKVSVSGAGDEIFENSPKRFKDIYRMVVESTSGVSQTLDNMAVTAFYLNGWIDHLENE